MDYESFLAKLPIKLNDQQKEAVQAVNGSVLLLAVPGSGKTTVLVARLGYMVYCQGINPSNILTLTYTVAAKNDMRDRFGRFFGNELASKMNFKTINSICESIIKYHGSQIGKEPYKLESDEKVLLHIISSIYKKYEKEYPIESELKEIKKLITYIKNMRLSDKEIRDLGINHNVVYLFNIYNEYCNELKKRKSMDYDDQMVYAYRLLKSSPELLEYYQNMYSYICVDEAQDTSKIQHEIIALLASKKENLFMVGDEDQSIYGFRAAYPEALLSFEKNHKGAKILLIEENFRSNANIVDAANMFIQKNTLRHKKHMRATKAAGAEIKEISLNSREAQYSYLLKVGQNCKEQTAILYRNNESAIPMVDLLERNNVPYCIRNAEFSFFTNRVVLDIQNIMIFSADMKNTDLFKCIYYKISTYLNKQIALKACDISHEYDISIFSAIFEYLDIKPHIRRNLELLETYFNNMRNENPQKAINCIIQHMGYGEYMKRTGLSNTKVFILETIARRENTVSGFLTRMEELRNIIQNKKNVNESLFILSTIHGSKGLEYNKVYLMDVEDGVFPSEEVLHDIKHDDKKAKERYEEERRIFYVGVTRAKNDLYLFSTQKPSTFIKQLFYKNYVEEDTKNQTISKSVKPAVKTNTYTKEKMKFSKEEFNAFVFDLTEGVRVAHKKYGQGVITKMNDTNVTISFGYVDKTFDLKILFTKNLLIIL